MRHFLVAAVPIQVLEVALTQDPEAVRTPVQGVAATPAPVEETMTGGTGPTLIASDQRSEISD